MNIRKKAAGETRTHWKIGSALLSAMLIGQQACAQGTSNLPKEYYQDADSNSPSAACHTLFPGGLGVPVTTVPPHEYILLFVFDNDPDSEGAGKTVFHADPKNSPDSPRKTVGCLADPDPTTDAKGTALKGWGIEVKGGCPTDCTGPHLFDLIKGLANKKSQTPQDADPLTQVGDGSKHWGIFLAPSGTGETSAVKVWQVRVKDANHARRVLNSLSGLNGMNGYLGHMLIGHRPIIDQANAANHK
jgi:hypothetical protein